jgi:hypothetical protein
MTDQALVQRFQALRARKDQVDRLLIERQTMLKSAEDSLSETRQRLQDEFGVASLEDAQALLTSLQNEVTLKLQALEQQISAYEASAGVVPVSF